MFERPLLICPGSRYLQRQIIKNIHSHAFEKKLKVNRKYRIWWSLISNKLFIKIVPAHQTNLFLFHGCWCIWIVCIKFFFSKRRFWLRYTSKYLHRILMKNFDAFGPALINVNVRQSSRHDSITMRNIREFSLPLAHIF